MLFNLEFAIWFAAFVGGVGLPEGGRSANRAGGHKVVEGLALGVGSEFAGFGDDVVGVGDDFAHEIGALEVAVLHLAEFEFPIAGEHWRVEALNVHLAN